MLTVEQAIPHLNKTLLYKYLSGRVVEILYAFCCVVNLGLDLLYCCDPDMNNLLDMSSENILYYSRAWSYNAVCFHASLYFKMQEYLL